MTNTVYVIGAGASYEVGFPTGRDLKINIANSLNIQRQAPSGGGYPDFLSGSEFFEKILKNYAHHKDGDFTKYNEYLQAANVIASGVDLALSIDNYIYSKDNSMITDICKLAIVYEILKAEKLSIISIYTSGDKLPNSLHGASKREHWYVKFFRLLSQDCTLPQLQKRLTTINFVIFNYDRSLEYYLASAISKFYGVTFEHALNNILNLNRFIHPYGKVADLSEIPYGSHIDNPSQILQLYENIHTFSERNTNNKEVIYALKSAISSANKLVFLGFGFHDINMQLMSVKNFFENSPIPLRQLKVIGTGYGLSESNRNVISEGLFEMLGSYRREKDEIDLTSTCSDLFDVSSLALSFDSPN